MISSAKSLPSMVSRAMSISTVQPRSRVGKRILSRTQPPATRRVTSGTSGWLATSTSNWKSLSSKGERGIGSLRLIESMGEGVGYLEGRDDGGEADE